MEVGTVNTCFICLSDDSVDALIRPCKCNLPVHRSCLTRWQLQRFGSRDEKYCRLCQEALPSWTSASACQLAPEDDELVQSVPMTIQVNGRTHVIAARPGVDGMVEFQSAVRRKLGLPENVQIVFAVSCSLPHCSNLTILVKGLRSYHAAIRCMSAQVRRRQQPLPQQAHTQQQHVAPCCGMHQHQNMASWCGMPLQTHRQPSVPTPAHSHTQEAPSLASSPPSSPATSPRSWTAKLDPEWEPDWVNVWEPSWEPVSDSCAAPLSMPVAEDSISSDLSSIFETVSDCSTALSDCSTTLCRVGGPHGTLREPHFPRHEWQFPPQHTNTQPAAAHHCHAAHANAGTSTTAALPRSGLQHVIR